VQELSGAANEILVSVEQIGRGAEMQASATLQTDTAMGQIERAAALAKERANTTQERLGALQTVVTEGKNTIEQLVKGVTSALQETREVSSLILQLGETTRRIEKTVDGLALAAVQVNMLAVSGSIESTRSGDAGAGLREFHPTSGNFREALQKTHSGRRRPFARCRTKSPNSAATSARMQRRPKSKSLAICRSSPRFAAMISELFHHAIGK